MSAPGSLAARGSFAARGSLAAVLAVLLAASLFGTLGILSRLAYASGLTPFAWVAWRAGVGAVAVWLLIGARRGPRSLLVGLRAAPRAARGWLAVAIVASACLNLAIFIAFDRTAIALALLCFYTYPAMVAVASVLFGHERFDGLKAAALGFASLGMVAVVAGGLQPGAAVSVDPLGIVLALLAGLSQTVFIMANRGYAAIRTDEAMGSILVGAAVIGGLVTIVVEGPAALVRPVGDLPLLGLLLVVGVFAAAVPSLIFQDGIRRLGPVRAGTLMLFEPVVGVLLAAVVLGEALTPIQLAGGAAILAGAAIVQRTRQPAPPVAAVAPAPGGP
jgi:drug/metabolite transporter (DMT)-like permease